MLASKKMASLAFALFFFGLMILAAYLNPEHIHPFRTYYNEIMLVIAVLVGFAALSWQAGVKLVLPPIASLPLALLLLIGLQWSLGMIAIQAVYFPAMVLLLTFLAIVLGATWVHGETSDQVKSLREAVCLTWAASHVLAALLSVVLQGVQIAGLNLTPFVMYMARDATAYMRPFANVAQPNQLALLLCFGLAGLWWLLQKRSLSNALAWVLGLVLIWGLALTQSRIAWIILPVFAVLSLSGFCGERRLAWYGVFSLLGTYFALLWFMPTIAQMIGFSSGDIGARIGGRSERTVLLQQAWEMAMQHPWLGGGWFSFGEQQVQIASQFSSTTYAEHAHNIVLNFLAEVGFPFTVAFFGYLLFWVWRTFLKSWAIRNTEFGFVFLCLVAVGVHSLVEFPLWYAYVLLPIALLMGASYVPQAQEKQVKVIAGRVFPFSVGALGLVLLCWVSWDYQRVINGFIAYRTAPNISLVKEEAIRMPSTTLLPDFFDYFQLQKIVPSEQMRAQDIAFVERMHHRFGFMHILNKMAEIYVLNGAPEKALHTMITLQRLHPISYPEYFDYWKALAENDERYRAVFMQMPKRDAQ
jgi:O-antigen ligase